MIDPHVYAELWAHITALQRHELRNPLQAIRAAVAVARIRNPSQNRDLYDIIDRNALMVDAILTDNPPPHLPAPSARLRPVLASSIVRDAIDDCRYIPTFASVRFDHRASPGEPPIHCRRSAMMRVCLNIFRNSATARADATVSISHSWDDGTVVCSVEDDGPGFPAEVRQAKGNSNLPHFGLQVVRDTVHECGGDVEFANSVGGGARVTMRFPRHDRMEGGAARVPC